MARHGASYVRHLSAGETISDMIHAYGADVVLHTALIRSKVPITRDLLDNAVSVLMRFQPSLRTCITSEKGPHGQGSYFVMNDPICDVDVIQASSRRAWVSIAEVELSRPFNSYLGPLWKLKYVEFKDVENEFSGLNTDDVDHGGITNTRAEYSHEGAILFAIHQALVDGMSMFDLLYRQLIAILNAIIERGDMSLFHNPIPLLPPVEVAFTKEPLNPSKNSFKEPANLQHLKAKHQLQFRPTLTCVGNGPPMGPSVTRLLPFMLPAEATKELIEKCYGHRISPKSVLVTAAAMSLAITATANNIAIGEVLRVCLPVDLRHYRPMPKPQPLGNWLGFDYISIVKQRNYIDLGYFWRDAQKVHENLLQQRQGWLDLTTSRGFFDHHRSIMKKIAKEQTVGPASDLHKGHFILYDLGNCDLMTGDTRPPAQQGPNGSIHSHMSGSSRHSRNSANGGESVRMMEHYFTSSMSDVTTIPLALTVCTYRGRLMWTLTYNGRWISKSFATKFIDRLLATISQLIAQSNDGDGLLDIPMHNAPLHGGPPDAPYPQQQYVPPPPVVPNPPGGMEPRIEPAPQPTSRTQASSMPRPKKKEDIHKLPPLIRMQRMKNK